MNAMTVRAKMEELVATARAIILVNVQHFGWVEIVKMVSETLFITHLKILFVEPHRISKYQKSLLLAHFYSTILYFKKKQYHKSISTFKSYQRNSRSVILCSKSLVWLFPATDPGFFSEELADLIK